VEGADFWWKEEFHFPMVQDLKIIFQQQHNNCFIDNLKWRVGRGTKISFWKDKWLGDNYNLQGKYPHLYLISK